MTKGKNSPIFMSLYCYLTGKDADFTESNDFAKIKLYTLVLQNQIVKSGPLRERPLLFSSTILYFLENCILFIFSLKSNAY